MVGFGVRSMWLLSGVDDALFLKRGHIIRDNGVHMNVGMWVRVSIVAVPGGRMGCFK